MFLKDKSMSKADKDEMLRMLDGCICRICVSDDPLEVVRMLGFANDYLAMLAQDRLLQNAVNVEVHLTNLREGPDNG